MKFHKPCGAKKHGSKDISLLLCQKIILDEALQIYDTNLGQKPSTGEGESDMYKETYMNTSNYFFEFRIIPALLEQVKLNKNPLQSLVDVEWIKAIMASNQVTIDWDTFSIDIYDEKGNKTTLENGKYIAYTFPKIIFPPDAKYGIIDINTRKYYTFESDFNNNIWAIGNQEKEVHHLVEMVEGDMSMAEFLKLIMNGSKLPNNTGENIFVIVVAVIVTIVTFVLTRLFID